MSIVVDKASLKLGGTDVLREVSIRADAGEVLGLLGPNGAGKSSLLSVMSGERKPGGGTVSLSGRQLAQYKPLDLARRRAVMPQSASVAFDFTVRAIVELGRYPHAGNSDRATDTRIVAQALELADAAHLAPRLYRGLSGGEQQRVQAARAMAQVWEEREDGSPRFLLLDEPTASLDLRHQQALLSAVTSFVGSRAGSVVVLHDINLAAAFCDRVAVMSRGSIVACGTPGEVLTVELLERVFEVRMQRVERRQSSRPAFLVDSTDGIGATA